MGHSANFIYAKGKTISYQVIGICVRELERHTEIDKNRDGE